MSSLVWLVVLAAIAAVAIGIWKSKALPPAAGPATHQPRIRGNGKFEVEVVGESFYTEAFRELFAAQVRADAEDDLVLDATLVLEDDNPHDSNAVAVYIRGRKVGHLARSMAADFRRAIVRDGWRAYRSFDVAARVYLGGDDETFSVSLDLPQA